VTTAATLEEHLPRWLGARLDATDVRLSGLVQHTEGFSWHTFTLDASWPDPETGDRRTEGFAVRVEPADGLLAPYDIHGQYRLQEALVGSGVPVPALRWLEPRSDVLGMPFYVMERVTGRVPVQWQPDDPEIFPTPDALHHFGQRFVDVQAQIHSLDWQALGLAFLASGEDPRASAQAQLAHWIDYYEQSRLTEIPVFREAIAWLRHHLQPSDRLVLCHGDYRIGNVMEADGDIVAVFDWELAHVGDPVEDVAYAGLPLWRGRDPRLSHFLLPDEYFERYADRTGLTIDTACYQAWTVFGLVKAGAVHLRAARAFEDGRTNDLRLAAMGHQVQHVARHVERAMQDGPS
jgi:aminoglycoside phosphotransferase (APT) family kinase protein